MTTERDRERRRMISEFRAMEREVDQIETDCRSWNDAHPEELINPDVSLERARLEKLRRHLQPLFDEERGRHERHE